MSVRPITIIEALEDKALLGGLPAFTDLTSWRRWLVFLRAVYGLPLDPDEEAIFRHHTGQSTYSPPPGGWREVVAVVGRQSGKTRIAAAVAAFEAMLTPPEADGTETYALLIAQDQRAALRTLFAYARAPFERISLLKQSVVNQRTDNLALTSGCVLAAYPCRPAAIRGLRSRVVVADELAYYRSSEGYPTDTEMLRAVRPTLATTGGRLIILSSPYAQTGALYDLHRRHYGRSGSLVLAWQGTAPEMNPTLSQDYLQRMAEDDPDAYRSEVLGEFRAGVSTLLDADALAACVDEGERERPLAAGLRYHAFADPSGGRRDKFTVGIAHRSGDRVVLDAIRAWAPPFNPSGVIEEAADLLKTYRLTQVTGDRYAAEFVTEQFRVHGITYTPSSRDHSQLYLELVPLVNARRALLLDVPELLRELRGLERRQGGSGRDRIDHRSGAHDDLAVACAGALVQARKPGGLSPSQMKMVLGAGRVQSRWSGLGPECGSNFGAPTFVPPGGF